MGNLLTIVVVIFLLPPGWEFTLTQTFANSHPENILPNSGIRRSSPQRRAGGINER